QGILMENIEKILTEKICYEPTVVACGRIPVNGKDGYAEILFLPESERPKSGKPFNLREIEMLQEVKDGQELIRQIPATAGEDGFTITGKIIGATAGREFLISPGRNTRYNAERTHILATRDGVVCQQGNSISVEEIKVLEKVDASTGHIRFDGVIKIRGNISDRYNVEGVRIDIGGTVGKSRLRSIGDIRVAQGIMGSMIQAGGSVIAQTITDAQVNATENVVVYDYIVNSKITAGNNIDMPTHHGYANGGALQAGNLIRLPKVGPPEELVREEDESEETPRGQTMLEVGISLNSRKQFNTLLEQVQNSFNEFEDKLKEFRLLLDKVSQRGIGGQDLQSLNSEGDELVKKNRTIFSSTKKIRLQSEINRLNDEVNGGIVFITGAVQVGTGISVRRMRYNVLKPATGMAYYFSQNGVQASDCETMLNDSRKYLLKLPN
ncbi:MAG: FapA family protein, partial [SAR324 cluster bacterium]|nr:FapA family protein [SAR324 cluster bacterium]